MAKKPEVGNEIEEIMNSAQEGFDLRARLANAPTLTKTVTVYTDAVTGKELGGAEDQTEHGIVVGRRRWGILGRVDEIEERSKALLKSIEDHPEFAADPALEIDTLAKELAVLKKKVAPLAKKLDASALAFTLRAVPDLVIRKSHHEARKTAGIKGKQGNITEEQSEKYGLAKTAIVLAASVVEYVDNASKKTVKSLSVDDAQALRDLLPPGQFHKLDIALYELSLESAIGNSVTDSPDF